MQDESHTIIWNIDTLMDACSKNPDEKNKIEIPKFQRARAWTNIQENLLIDTMKSNHLSIGALQLFRISNKKMHTYLLADGLHRCTTLKNYYLNPFKFDRTGNLINNIKNELIAEYKKVYSKDVIDNLCNKWFKYDTLGSYKDFVIERTYNEKSDDLKNMIKHYIDQKDRDDIYKFMKEQTKLLSEKINISKTNITIIVNVGTMSDMALLFERINTAGSTLSYSEILSAKWYTCDKIKVDNKEIKENIKKHYEKIKCENNDMDICEDDDKTDVCEDDKNMFRPYEYIIGLNSYLMNSVKNSIYTYVKDKEFIFKVLSYCFYGNSNKTLMNGLHEKITELDDNDQLKDLEKNLEWSYRFVAKALNPITLCVTEDTNSLLKEIPLIIALTALTYKNKTQIEKNKDYYTKTYQLNLLNNKISTSSFITKDISQMLTAKTYMKKVLLTEFKGKFDKFILDDIRIKKEKGISPTGKVILLFMKNIYDDYDDAISYKFNKIVKDETFLSFQKHNDVNLNKTSLGNWCMHKMYNVKRERNDTIDTYLEKCKIDIENVYSDILFLDFKSNDYDDIINRQEIAKKSYGDFIKARMNNMKNIIIKEYAKYFENDTSKSESESESSDESDSRKEQSVRKYKINTKNNQLVRH